MPPHHAGTRRLTWHVLQVGWGMSAGLRVCLAWIAGAALGVVVDGVLDEAIGLGLAAVAIGVIWPRRVVALVVVAAAATAYGAGARIAMVRPVPVELLGAEPQLVTGVLLSDAALSRGGVRVELLIQGRRARITVGGGLGPSASQAWTRGRTLRAPVRLRLPDVVRNPGSPGVEWQRLTQPFELLGTIKSAALVEVAPAPWPEELAARVRQHVRRSAERFVGPHAATSQAVVTAILIGDRAGLDEALVRRLQAAGTFHVIAISGGNVAMLTMACLLGFRLVTRSQTMPLVSTMVVVAAYGGVVGDEASVTRAVFAALCYLGLRLRGVPPKPVNLLAVVAAVCVVWSPLTVLDVGAWLSFGATFGLIVILPRLVDHVRRHAASRRGWRMVWDWLVVACLATVAAELLIMPVSAHVFGRVTVAGLLLNLVAIPAMGVVQLAGMTVCVLALVSEPAAAAAAWLAHHATTVLLGSSAALDLAPWLSWRVPASSLVWTGAYYAALILAVVCTRPATRRAAVVLAASLLTVIVTSPFVTLRRPPGGWLRVSILDVGQGEAVLVQTPSRHALLVDSGGTPGGSFDVGGRVTTPAVWALGERGIDWLVLTHGDLDHIGGARRVVEDLSPREVWEGIPVDADPTLRELRSLAQQRAIAWRRLHAGHELELGAVQIAVRHPQPPDWQRVRVRNDDSLVLEVRYGDVSVLLTGDAGLEYESRPLAVDRTGAPPRIRILKVAHHGSRSSTSEQFLDRYRPHAAIISAGASNLFGHPAPDILARLSARDIRVFRTDQHGAVILETDGRSVRLRSISGRVMDVS